MTFLTIALAVAAVCVLVALLRTARRHGPFRWRCLCGATEPTPEFAALHEQHCPDCQSIIARLKETP